MTKEGERRHGGRNEGCSSLELLKCIDPMVPDAVKYLFCQLDVSFSLIETLGNLLLHVPVHEHPSEEVVRKLQRRHLLPHSYRTVSLESS